MANQKCEFFLCLRGNDGSEELSLRGVQRRSNLGLSFRTTTRNLATLKTLD